MRHAAVTAEAHDERHHRRRDKRPHKQSTKETHGRGYNRACRTDQALICFSESQRLRGLPGLSGPPLLTPPRGPALDNPKALRACSNVASSASAAKTPPATRGESAGQHSAE